MFLLDTMVVSELRKMRTRRAEVQVAAWVETQDAASFWLSVMSAQELTRGILLKQRSDPAQALHLREWLDRTMTSFEDRILPITLEIALRCAELHVPTTRPDRDALIAATALVHDLTVVTRNVQDFHHTGVRLLNPWHPQPSHA